MSHARIEVSLKPGHSDPEGETTAKLLFTTTDGNAIAYQWTAEAEL